MLGHDFMNILGHWNVKFRCTNIRYISHSSFMQSQLEKKDRSSTTCLDMILVVIPCGIHTARKLYKTSISSFSFFFFFMRGTQMKIKWLFYLLNTNNLSTWMINNIFYDSLKKADIVRTDELMKLISSKVILYF